MCDRGAGWQVAGDLCQPVLAVSRVLRACPVELTREGAAGGRYRAPPGRR